VATATPAVSPTPAPRVHSVWLPVVAAGACLPGAGPADVALVLDASRSMGEVLPSGMSKLAAAASALDHFLALLRPGSRSALVVFSDQATLVAPFSKDPAAARGALRRVTPAGESRLDRGLAAGRDAMKAGGPTRAMVLVSDGRVSPEVRSAAVAEAEAAKAAGITLYAVGVGRAVDAVTLRRVASGDQFYWAQSDEDLKSVASAIAVLLPCPLAGTPGGGVGRPLALGQRGSRPGEGG